MIIVPYREIYKQSVFEFTDICFEELDKTFEPAGRHSFYNDIEKSFEVFYCVVNEENNDNKVLGTVGLKEINNDTVELKAFYLHKDLRGKGLGKRMLETVISKAGELGYRSIVLDSISKYKAAQRLYEKAGFVNTERYNDNQYADVFMKLEL
ncbi:GNAT family N-acetyltransferase [Ruminococcus sp. HUN007]|uniref:GNAT family N-acetyltransferase n=1 Tax=Ruminococcus sp. HUN007 TaxID=1514668 RepID=UPI0006798B99|nr:GNAT family N-acetyltransferase [Ruminococcus sp. HUN007]